MKKNIQIHLSDIDLDGYGSQYLMNLIKPDVYYYSNKIYKTGESLNEIFSLILKNQDKEIDFLITDLGLPIEQCYKIHNFINGNKHIQLNVHLIDHHKTSKEQSEIFDWFHLDTSKCACYLTAEYLVHKYNIKNSKRKYILAFGDFVNAHDMFIKEHKYHHQSNYLSDIIFTMIQYPEYLKKAERKHIFYNINELFRLFYELNESTRTVQNSIFNINEKYLEHKIDNNIYLDDNIAYEHKLHYYYYILLKDLILNEELSFLEIDDYTYLPLYNIDSGVFQYMSHYLLMDKSLNIDFMINIKFNGKLSLRSENKTDVSEIAKKYFNGGGHPAASGGYIKEKFKNKKDMYDYLEILKNP